MYVYVCRVYIHYILFIYIYTLYTYIHYMILLQITVWQLANYMDKTKKNPYFSLWASLNVIMLFSISSMITFSFSRTKEKFTKQNYKMVPALILPVICSWLGESNSLFFHHRYNEWIPWCNEVQVVHIHVYEFIEFWVHTSAWHTWW